MVRDNGGGRVWEYVDYEVNASTLEFMRKVAASKETIVRFQGDDYSKDITLGSTDKGAIKQAIESYDALIGAGYTGW